MTDTINRVSENQTAIAAAVEQQTATTQEIGRNTAQAAQGSSEPSSAKAGRKSAGLKVVHCGKGYPTTV